MAPVALVIGVEETSIKIGRATLRVMPLVVLAGRFDANGEYRWELPVSGQGDFSVLVQAISVDELGFTASDLWRVEYSAGGKICLSFPALQIGSGL